MMASISLRCAGLMLPSPEAVFCVAGAGAVTVSDRGGLRRRRKLVLPDGKRSAYQ